MHNCDVITRLVSDEIKRFLYLIYAMQLLIILERLIIAIILNSASYEWPYGRD
jgi:hypothetical protein